MERLTERKENGHVVCGEKPRGNLCETFFCKNARGCPKIDDRTRLYLRVFDRLAAYEDTGLEPEEIVAALRRTVEDDKAKEEGTWQNVYLSSPSSFVGTCSICGISNDIPPPVSAHYCPNCGAKMSDEAIWKALGGGEGG